ncbi:MAG: hypothetical protein IPJ98_03660 [Bryobacterales bacterium]|nr:hypothetical protein [Bryobacterales bacterium]
MTGSVIHSEQRSELGSFLDGRHLCSLLRLLGALEIDTLAWVPMGALCLAGVLTIALNPRKRALPDFIAGSFVMIKRSYDAIHAPVPPCKAPTPGNGFAEAGPA